MEKADGLGAFRKHIETVAAHGVLSMGMALGTKLNLFDALAKVASKEDPKSAKIIADAANMKERYVQEWLNTMVCGNIIEITETGDKYWIPEERVQDLTHGTTNAMFSRQLFLPIVGGVFNELCEVFKKDGPLGMGYEPYADFYNVMNEVSHAKHEKYLISNFVPLTGLAEALNFGTTTVLDVGCGSGYHVCHFAEHFPNCHFVGIDISQVAIDEAKQYGKEKKLRNAEFIKGDACQMSDEWKDKFDWIFIIDTCHDLRRADLVLKEIHRVLKPGGVFSMLDVDGTSNPYEDRRAGGHLAAYFYGISMFHCLPIASNSKDALGLGAMWGQKRAVEVVKSAGFEDIQVVPTPFFPGNVLYLCKKEGH